MPTHTPALPEENFLSLNASYPLPQHADWQSLMEDVHCLLNSAVEIVENEAADRESPALFGAVYLLQMASNLALKAHTEAVKQCNTTN